MAFPHALEANSLNVSSTFSSMDSEAMNMTWDQEIDVLVIGAGGSGLMTAIRAADLGAKVALIEKSEKFGGTTALSGGCLWIPANHLQPKNGSDSPDCALRYLKNLTKGSVKDKILETYVSRSREMLQYLDRESDLKFAVCEKYCDYYPEVDGGQLGGRTVEVEYYDGESLGTDRKRLRDPQITLMFGEISLTAREAHTLVTGGKTGWYLAIKKCLSYLFAIAFRRRHGRDRCLALGQGLVAGLWNLARKKGVEPQFGVQLQKLMIQENRVVGAQLALPSGTASVKVNGGIVLACGGFSRNETIKRQYQNTSAEWGAAIEEDIGDALNFCAPLKPAMAMMNEAWWMPVMKVPGEDFARSSVVDRSLPGCIIVDQAGKRFANESAPYEDFVRAMLADPQRVPAWLITDNFHRQNYTLGHLLPGKYFPKALWLKGLENNWIYVANNINDLANKLQISQTQLAETINRFNQDAALGQDPQFKRGKSAYDRYYADNSVGKNPCLRPLKDLPFYAVPLYPGDLGTKGGFAINEKAQILGENGLPIEGLYAVGNAAANPIGNIYPGAGGTLGPGLTFGYIAAESIVSEQLSSVK